jgi:hypothetical protein
MYLKTPKKHTCTSLVFKTIFLYLLLVPTFTFAQNLQINDPGLDSLINNSEPVITPMAGANAGNGLVPDSTPTNTGSTNTQGNTSGQIDTSILNQPAYNSPTVVPFDPRLDPQNQLIKDQAMNGSFFDSIAPAATFGGQPLSNLLNQIFYIGLGIAVVLAIVMIVRGGIQYMTIDAASSKDSGKKMVQAAIGGLVLAFAGILILNTINPKLTELNLSFNPLMQTGTVVEQQIMNAVAGYNQITPEQYAEMVRTGKIPTNLTPAAQKILAEALNSVGTLKTGAIPGTDGGNKACAAAVNKIIEAATGQQAGGGLSTAAMYTALQSNSKFQLVGSSYANAQPGDIIISPTSGGSTGHVGIVAAQGATSIISNSSKNAEVRANHSATSWNSYYGEKKGLPVYIYRPL